MQRVSESWPNVPAYRAPGPAKTNKRKIREWPIISAHSPRIRDNALRIHFYKKLWTLPCNPDNRLNSSSYDIVPPVRQAKQKLHRPLPLRLRRNLCKELIRFKNLPLVISKSNCRR